MLKAISTITNALGALNYKGTWNASSNTPTLADGTGAKGDYYVVSTAGTQTFGGVQLFFGAGDWIAYNGAVWQRVEGGSDGNFANVTLTSTDAGATAAPILDLYRDSATPAVSDTLGEIEFNGEDSAGNKQAYGLIHASILSPTSTAEQGQLHFETATAGALTEKMIIGTTNLVINEIGAVFNVRIEGDTDANLFYTDATNSRIGIGTITPTAKLEVAGKTIVGSTSSNALEVFSDGDTEIGFSYSTKGNIYAKIIGDTTGASPLKGEIAFQTASGGTLTERARITSGGYFKASNAGTYNDATGLYHEFRGDSANSYVVVTACTNATPLSEYIQDFRFSAATPNDASARFWSCTDATAVRAYMLSNGGLANYAANNVILSDRREKTNFAPATSYLDKICAIPVQTFNYIDQNMEEDGGLTLGVVAQDVQAVAPELVSEGNWGSKDKPKMRLEIYQTDLQYALMKCIQEMKEIIDDQNQRIAILEAR
jgi:hypothetical protein